MIKHVFGLIFLFISMGSFAQGYEIVVKLSNYNDEVLKLGYHFGDKQYIKDSARIDSKTGTFTFKSDTLTDAGVYLVVMAPDNKYFQIIVDRDEQRFTLTADASSPEKTVEFKGSAQNTLFYDYMGYLSETRLIVDSLRSQYSGEDQADMLKEKLQELNSTVRSYQRDFIKKYPDYLLSGIISLNLEVDVPEFEGTEEEIALARFYYARDHYFDMIDPNDERLIRTPVLFQKVDAYVNKLHAIIPDSSLVAVDKVLNIFKDNNAAWRFFLSHFLNYYNKSKYVGMDMVYVHIAEEYYGKGMAPWVGEENLEKILKQANVLKPLLLGKVAPDMLMQLEDGTDISLHEIEADFVVVLFWAPDCGHCQKSMPEVTDFADKYKDQGVVVFSVCGKVGDTADCWKMVRSKKMQNLLNVSDGKYRSRYKERYDVQSTPKIYILDKEKKIVSKNIGSQQLDEIVGRFIEFSKTEQQ